MYQYVRMQQKKKQWQTKAAEKAAKKAGKKAAKKEPVLEAAGEELPF